MTDYLEELLEEQEQEGTARTVRWRRPVIRPAAEREEAPQVVQFEDLWQIRPGQELLEQPQENAVEALVHELVRTSRAVRQAQRLTGPAQGVASGGLNGQTVHMTWGGINHPARTEDYPALVDTAFQRDARRYDGALRLL